MILGSYRTYCCQTGLSCRQALAGFTSLALLRRSLASSLSSCLDRDLGSGQEPNRGRSFVEAALGWRSHCSSPFSPRRWWSVIGIATSLPGARGGSSSASGEPILGWDGYSRPRAPHRYKTETAK